MDACAVQERVRARLGGPVPVELADRIKAAVGDGIPEDRVGALIAELLDGEDAAPRAQIA